MGKKLWVSLTNALGSTINELVCKCSFPRPIAQFLAARGISPDKVDVYMNPTLNNLSDPFRFPGIGKAVEEARNKVYKLLKKIYIPKQTIYRLISLNLIGSLLQYSEITKNPAIAGVANELLFFLSIFKLTKENVPQKNAILPMLTENTLSYYGK